MKRLLVMRHAKSSWDDPRQRDFDRPLNERGRMAAPLIAAAIAEKGWRPDVILCSPALRTRETLDRMKPRLGPSIPVAYRDGLYLASLDRLYSEIERLSDQDTTALVIAHNPGVQELSLSLCDEPSCASDRFERIAIKFPTGAVTAFALPASGWRQISPQTGTLLDFITPKALSRSK